ncbi:MAG: hypothetical protein COB53_01370 [Elusimicrobia bacterium]|nr:MAG: hypothetical protein COB53_01370 [Elusimicrobiota bacterium]
MKALASLLFFLTTAASATPWHNLGPRAMGMGGAHVAIAQGPSAAYWNPAGLGQLFDSSGVEILAGIRVEATGGVLLGANDLNQLAKDCSKTPQVCTTERVNKALDRMDHLGNGASFDGALAVGARVGSGMLFVHSLTYVGGTPEVDHAVNSGDLALNNSKLILRGGNFTHIGYGMGRELGKSGIVIGANLKLIVGSVGYRQMIIVNEDPGPGSIWRYDKNSKTSLAPGIDVGAFWDMRETFPSLPARPRLGIVGRNVNAPTFEQPDAATSAGDRTRFPLNGQVRAGLAIQPYDFVTMAADIDLTNNTTSIDRFQSRFLSLGMELRLHNKGFFLPLRLGLQKNVANADSALAFTTGTSFEFSQFKFEVALQLSPTVTAIQSERVTKRLPNNLAGSIRLAWEFGQVDPGNAALPY